MPPLPDADPHALPVWAVLATVPVPLWIVRQDRLLFANPAARPVAGDAWHDREWRQYVAASSHDAAAALLAVALAGQVATATLTLQTAAGRTISVDATASSLPAVPDALQVYWRERSAAAEAAERDEWQALANNLPDCMLFQVCIDAEGRHQFLRLCDAVEALHGLTATAVRQNPDLLISQLLPEYRAAMETGYREAAAQGKPLRLDFRARVASGDVRWFRVASSPRTLPGGTIVWDGVETDITAQKLVELALRQRDEMLQLAQTAAGLGTWTLDLTTWQATVSDSFLSVCGLPARPGNLVSMDERLSVVHPEDVPRLVAVHRSLVRQELDQVELEFRVNTPAGQRWLISRSRVLRDGEGLPTRVCGADIDITEAKLAAIKLAGQSKVLEMIVREEPMNAILHEVALLAEQLIPGALCSIHLMDESRPLLVNCIGPSLPVDYRQRLEEEGVPVGAIAGSCGTAAYRCEPVMVPDLGNSPLWAAHPEAQEHAVRVGLRACWSRPLLGRDGKVRGTIAMYHRDVRSPHASETERIADCERLALLAIERASSAAALRTNERLLRMIYEGARIGTWTVDLVQGRTEQVTNAAMLFGQESFPVPADFLSAVLPEDRPRLLEAYERALVTGEYEALFRTVPHSGGSRYIYAKAGVFRAPDGTPQRLAGINIDVTERELGRQALEASEERLRQAQQIAGIATSDLVMDGAGVAICSPEYFELYGLPPDHGPLPIAVWLQRIHPDDRARVQAAKSGAIAGPGDTWQDEYRIVRPDGTERWLGSRARIVRDGQGKAKRLIGVHMDITERKAVEEELARRVEQRTQELLGTLKELEAFSYSVSHDLRAPLRSVQGFGDILIREYPGRVLDEEGQDYLARMVRAAGRMGQLIEDLLRLSRVGRSPLERHEVDLAPLAEAVLDDLRAHYPAVPVQSTVQHPLPAHGDQRLLRLVLENLIGNAWKFSAKQAQPRIAVGLQQEGSRRVYYVRDNGVGFDMQYAGQLFRPFQRLHRADEFEGTGIGLAIVQRVVHRHGGRIWVESAVGQGTAFFFTVDTGD